MPGFLKSGHFSGVMAIVLGVLLHRARQSHRLRVPAPARLVKPYVIRKLRLGPIVQMVVVIAFLFLGPRLLGPERLPV